MFSINKLHHQHNYSIVFEHYPMNKYNARALSRELRELKASVRLKVMLHCKSVSIAAKKPYSFSFSISRAITLGTINHRFLWNSTFSFDSCSTINKRKRFIQKIIASTICAMFNSNVLIVCSFRVDRIPFKTQYVEFSSVKKTNEQTRFHSVLFEVLFVNEIVCMAKSWFNLMGFHSQMESHTPAKVIVHFRTIKNNQLNDIIIWEIIDFLRDFSSTNACPSTCSSTFTCTLLPQTKCYVVHTL